MPPSVMSMSRASVDSQRSVTFFVDLNDDNLMARSAIVTPRPVSGRRTRSAQSDRMTQSMYVRSDSQSSGVSFFVDLGESSKAGSSNRLVHSMSREEADPDLDELSEDMRVKSRLLLAQNLEQTKAFFKKLKGYVDFLATPSYRKEELRQKRRLAENISKLMFQEEHKLKKGITIKFGKCSDRTTSYLRTEWNECIILVQSTAIFRNFREMNFFTKLDVLY